MKKTAKKFPTKEAFQEWLQKRKCVRFKILSNTCPLARMSNTEVTKWEYYRLENEMSVKIPFVRSHKLPLWAKRFVAKLPVGVTISGATAYKVGFST